jgi:hypothetical protein
MPLIIPANSITGGYEVDNSLRFDGASSDYLSRTFGASGNTKTFTFSFWVKKCELATNPDTMSDAQMLFGGQQSGYPAFQCLFLHTNDTIFIKDAQGATDIQLSIKTEMQFRDPSAWYHIVFAVDTTQATESDRAKLYVNGVLQTALDGENASGGARDTPLYPPQNTDLQFNSNEAHYINKYATNYEDMYMAEFVFIDGQQLDATSFGEFDADTGIWKPIDVSGLTFGTNGLYLDFENSGSLGADVSGNGNNFTVNNLTSIDQTTDTPTNNYATLNLLYSQVHILSQGNLEYTSSTSDWDSSLSTIAVSSGKWYWETKLSSLDDSSFRFYMGICDERDGNLIAKNQVGQNPAGRVGDTIGLIPDGGSPDAVKNGSSTGSWSTNSVNDIIGIAVDCDNGAVYFSKNGTFMNSGDPTSGASKTGGITFTTGQTYLMGVTVYGDSPAQQQLNFGNPIHSISSGNSDGNGYGNFEYSVPSGYYALNTKNLAEYG